MDTATRFDVAKIRHDMAKKGWIPTDLARATGLSDMTISRFLRGTVQTARTAKKIAQALGHSVHRYVLPLSGEAVA